MKEKNWKKKIFAKIKEMLKFFCEKCHNDDNDDCEKKNERRKAV